MNINRPVSAAGASYQIRSQVQLSKQKSNIIATSQSQGKMLTLDQFLALDQRIITAQKQLENYKVNTWNQQFLYKTINTANLNSAFLDHNQKFQDLIQVINQFNEEVLEAQKAQTQLRNGAWRTAFCENLVNILREILFTVNRPVQAKFVDQTYEWAMDLLTKMDYQSKKNDDSISFTKKRPMTADRSKYGSWDKRPMSSISSNPKLRPMSGYPSTGIDTQFETTMNFSFTSRPESAKMKIIEEEEGGELNEQQKNLSLKNLTFQMQPSDVINEQLREYNSHARTKHEDYEPPQMRLHKFKRKIISGESQKQQQQKPNIPLPYKTFPKPKIIKEVAYELYEEPAEEVVEVEPNPELDQEQKLDQEQQQQEQQKPEAVEEQPAVVENVDVPLIEVKTKKKKKKKKIVEEEYVDIQPLVKVFKNDEQGMDPQMYDLNTKYEQRSNLLNYLPSNDAKEMRTEEIYIKAKQKKAREKREDEELVVMINEWSHAKGRIEKEINRRVESAHYGHRFSEVQMIERAGKDVDQKELDKIQKKHLKEINRKPDQNPDLELSDISGEDQQQQEEVFYQFRKNKFQHFIVDDGEEDDFDKDVSQIKSKQRPYSSIQPSNRYIDMQGKLPSSNKPTKFLNNTDFHDLELKMSKNKIQLAKKMHQKVLGLPTLQEELIEKEINAREKLAPTDSLSIYSSEKQFRNPFRPFSAALERSPADKVRQEQVKEIVEIKNRMAKHKLNVPVQTLMNALLVPDPYMTIAQEGKEIPIPGFNILDNPFEKKKKKKKGGKKKKRKT